MYYLQIKLILTHHYYIRYDVIQGFADVFIAVWGSDESRDGPRWACALPKRPRPGASRSRYSNRAVSNSTVIREAV